MLLDKGTLNQMIEFNDWYIADLRFLFFELKDFAPVNAVAYRTFADIPLTDLCHLWSTFETDLNCCHFDRARNKVLRSDRFQNALRWLKDNHNDLVRLFYFFNGWVRGLDKDAYDAFEDKIESTSEVFDLLQTIWANSSVDWWLPKRQYKPLHKHSKNK